MELLIIIAAIWGVGSLVSRAVKRTAKEAKQAERGEAKPVMPGTIERTGRMSVWDQVTEMMSDTLNMRLSPEDEEVPTYDEEAHGSLGHHSHEGIHSSGSLEVRPLHDAMAHVPMRLPEQVKAEKRPVKRLARFGAGDLKRAVILSEVLNKPVSIRND